MSSATITMSSKTEVGDEVARDVIDSEELVGEARLGWNPC